MQASLLESHFDFSSLYDYAGHLISFVQGPEGLTFAFVLLVPILITASLRQRMATLLVLLLSIGLLTLFAMPDSGLITLGVVGTLSCYFIALTTMVARRRRLELTEQLSNLRMRVAQLESVEQRRLLLELKEKQSSAQAELEFGSSDTRHELLQPLSPPRLHKN